MTERSSPTTSLKTRPATVAGAAVVMLLARPAARAVLADGVDPSMVAPHSSRSSVTVRREESPMPETGAGRSALAPPVITPRTSVPLVGCGGVVEYLAGTFQTSFAGNRVVADDDVDRSGVDGPGAVSSAGWSSVTTTPPVSRSPRTASSAAATPSAAFPAAEDDDVLERRQVVLPVGDPEYVAFERNMAVDHAFGRRRLDAGFDAIQREVVGRRSCE